MITFDKDIKTVRDLARIHYELNNYEYSPKWADKEMYADLDEKLAELGFKISNKDYIPGEYNDIKGYYDFKVKPIKKS